MMGPIPAAIIVAVLHLLVSVFIVRMYGRKR